MKIEIGKKYRAQFEDGKNFYYLVEGIVTGHETEYEYICSGYFEHEVLKQRMKVCYYLNEDGNWSDANGYSIETIEEYEWI